MRIASGLLIATLVATASPALADPTTRISAGVGLGFMQSEENAGSDPNHTLNLFGRLRMARRVSGQLEITRIATEDGSGVDLRSVSGLLVVDLGRSRLMPIAIAGLGVDNETSDYTDRDYIHAFLGIGAEYRADNGFFVGADLRLGGRVTTEPQYKTQPVEDVIYKLPASDLDEGEFRSARITMGVRF